ncbi:MAG: hypothetical protein H6832_00065 [Planctomycetes bacterium]|nr:hypothetical protein [Planctomycetota bacterium]MCB9916776.1 hypothetical protein [Planctomycetota bacterium]
MRTHGSLRFALCVGSFAMVGCENCAKRVQPQAERDLAALQRHWDGEALDAFVAHANQTRYLDDASGLADRLSQLRADVGAIRQKAEPLIDAKPADARAYAVAHQVFACETGVLEFSVAYDTELRIVGFHVNGNAMPAAPR